MRKIILFLVLIMLIGCAVFVGIKSDGFTNLEKVFDTVYEKIDKVVNPSAAAVADTSDKELNKYIIYNESRTLIDDKTYISYRHKYSDDFNSTNSDSLYYLEIDAQLTTNFEFADFSVYYGEENFDNGMAIEIYKSTTDAGKYICKFGFGEYVYSPNSSQDYEFEISQEFEISVGEYYFYLVFDSVKETIILCHYDYLSTIKPESDYFEQALKFPIITLDKHGDTSNEYECLSNLFDNRQNPFLYRSSVLSQNENIYREVITKEYYKSFEFINLPPREGYTFKGFFYDEEFTQPYTGFPVKPMDELYQKWEINTYKVTYDCRTVDDFNLDLIERTYTYGEYIDYTPVREGYDFICWINDKNNQEYNAAEKITSNLYLRAQWGIHKIKITYVDSDESFLYEQFIEKGEYANYVPKKIGFKFIGWCNYEPGWPINEDITLKACWITAECTITLFINNNVYKAYKVGFGQSLSVFLNDIGIKQKYIAKYAYADLTGSNIPIEEISVEQDMRIDISDSFVKNQDIVASINENKSLIVLCSGAGGAVVLILVLGAIFGGKKKKSKR